MYFHKKIGIFAYSMPFWRNTVHPIYLLLFICLKIKSYSPFYEKIFKNLSRKFPRKSSLLFDESRKFWYTLLSARI